MRITIQDVKNSLGVSETYDIVNAIRNSNGDAFSRYVPLANANNIADVGAGIQITKAIQNDFIVSLIDRIGLVVVSKLSLKNPLAKFKKGKMVDGRTIEEIYTDLIKAQKFDPDTAESEVFKRVMPNVKTLFHERDRQEFYKLTVSDAQLRSAFTSWSAFDSFLANIISSIYNSAEVDEYRYMMFLIDNYYSKGLFTVVKTVDPVDQTSTTQFIKTLRATATKMTLPMGSRDFNAMAVTQRSEMDGLHLFIDADLQAEIDVDVLARAFNMDKTNFLGHVTVIDGFASTGLRAVLVDEAWFMVYDNLTSLETIRNPQGLYWNYNYHVWQILSASRFQNAVAFATANVPAVTSVIVDPPLAELKAGKTMQLTAYVRATDGQEHPVTWEVAGSTSATTLKGGTGVTQNGILTIDATQTGELLITATIAGVGVDTDGAGADTTDVIGEAIVTVIPAS
jgi:uncharacterized protein YjdB